MYCPNCGKENEDAVQVCGACGKSLSTQIPPVQSAQEVYNNQGQQPANVDANSPGVPTYNQITNNEFPVELNRFNWGAFLLTWIWGIGHGVWISLIALVAGFVPFIGGLIGLAFAIYLGIKGNELAWKTGKYNDIEAFKATERKWTIAGIIILLVGTFIIVPILVLIVIGATRGDMDRANDAKKKADLTRIQVSLEDCYDSTTASYPKDLNDECVSSKFDNGTPKDPVTGEDYGYKPSGIPAKSYTLTAKVKSTGVGTENGLYVLKSRQ